MSAASAPPASGVAKVLTGLDRVAVADPEALRWVKGKRIGLLAHPASVDRSLCHARDVLLRAGAQIGVLFGPEHGFGAEAQDMEAVTSSRDPRTGAPIHSLYGDDEEALSPQPRWLEGLDAVVVDLQDVGSRYYTFVWTAALMLRAAAAQGVQTIVLDRPNPLDGMTLEGAPQDPGYRSFVGLYEVAVRHAMTLGELCERVRRLEGLDADALHVVRMQGWRRWMRFQDTGLPWVLPSPNMPTPDTACVYPGGCLLEGTELSEGRGTTRPFEIWGAPGVDGQQLAREVYAPGAVLRPLSFKPMFQKHAGRLCGGVQVHIADPTALRSFALYMQLIAAVRRLAPDAFEWRQHAYEFVQDRPAIDLLTGGPRFRETVDADASLDELLAEHAAGAGRFARAREVDLLYR